MCVNDHIAFSHVESVGFRGVLRLLYPAIDQIPLSRRTIRRRADEACLIEKQKIKTQLRDAVSKIHLSFDMWTSPNRYAVLGIVAHFVRRVVANDKMRYQNHAVLLGMKRMKAGHGAADMAEVIRNTCMDFEIDQRLGCFQSDNPSFNDKHGAKSTGGVGTDLPVLGRAQSSVHWPYY